MARRAPPRPRETRTSWTSYCPTLGPACDTVRAMRSVCVYLSSSAGRPEDVAAIQALARELAARKIVLVYGGAHRGLMGVLADAMLAAGGTVIGVIPRAL